MEPNQVDLDLAAANALLNSGGIRAEKYDHPGTVVLGTILSAKEDLEYEMELQNGKWVRTGEIRKWKNSNEPKKQIVITVQTDLREDENDDGRRLMFFDSYRLPALRDALQKVNVKNLSIGAQIAKRWDSGSGNPGDPKVYTVAYAAPALDPGSMLANGNGQATQPAQAAQPTQAAPMLAPGPAPVPAAPPSLLASNGTVPAAQAGPPAGVDPGVWAALPEAQRNAVLAAMSNPAASVAPF